MYNKQITVRLSLYCCRYVATITAVSVGGKFIVTFETYGNQEEVDREDVKAVVAEPAETVVSLYKGEV